jgi:hypothetical protein
MSIDFGLLGFHWLLGSMHRRGCHRILLFGYTYHPECCDIVLIRRKGTVSPEVLLLIGFQLALEPPL